MRQICALEIRILSEELDKELKSYRIDKFYETGNGRFRFRLSSERKKVELVCVLCKRINPTDTIEASEKPTNFAVAMRKRISNFSIAYVSQINDDRIICIGIRKGEEEGKLIFEMFGKGNLIMTGMDDKISIAYSNHRFKDRAIFPKERYVPPRNDGLRITSIQETSKYLQGLVSSAKGNESVIKAVVGATNIGTLYVENAIMEAGIDLKKPMKEINQEDINAIGSRILALEEVIKAPSPRVYTKDGQPVDYSVSDIRKIDSEAVRFDKLHKALDFYSKNEKVEVEERENPEAKELEISIQRQKESLKRIEAGIENNRRAGEMIFENMHIINNLIQAAQQDRHITREKLQEMFPDLEIIDVDLKNKKIRLKMG